MLMDFLPACLPVVAVHCKTRADGRRGAIESWRAMGLEPALVPSAVLLVPRVSSLGRLD